MAARLAPGDTVIGFAALTHDLGKALTPADELPRHVKHEQRGLAPLRALCERMKVPTAHRELALTACREHLNVHRLHELRDTTVPDQMADRKSVVEGKSGSVLVELGGRGTLKKKQT